MAYETMTRQEELQFIASEVLTGLAVVEGGARKYDRRRVEAVNALYDAFSARRRAAMAVNGHPLLPEVGYSPLPNLIKEHGGRVLNLLPPLIEQVGGKPHPDSPRHITSNPITIDNAPENTAGYDKIISHVWLSRGSTDCLYGGGIDFYIADSQGEHEAVGLCKSEHYAFNANSLSTSLVDAMEVCGIVELEANAVFLGEMVNLAQS